MAELIVTPLAHEDLSHVVSYIAVNLSNPDAADTFLDDVDECYVHMRENPRMYAFCTDTRLLLLQYRKAVIGNYVLIHRYDETTDTVIVLRCFYVAQDYVKLL